MPRLKARFQKLGYEVLLESPSGAKPDLNLRRFQVIIAAHTYLEALTSRVRGGVLYVHSAHGVHIDIQVRLGLPPLSKMCI